MSYVCDVFRIVFVLKHYCECDCNYQRITGKRKPDVVPIPYSVMGKIFIDDHSADYSAKEGTCAEERIFESVVVSTKSEPDILQKSNAIP